jgi:hypothetical protein
VVEGASDLFLAAQDALEQLKAQFALPFGLSGASAAAPVAEQGAPKEDVPEPQAPTAPETAAEPATPEEARAIQAASVRDVMEQLRSENRFDMLQPGANAAAAAQGSGPASRGALPNDLGSRARQILHACANISLNLKMNIRTIS